MLLKVVSECKQHQLFFCVTGPASSWFKHHGFLSPSLKDHVHRRTLLTEGLGNIAGRLICFMFTNPKDWQEKLEKSMRLNVTWITCLEIGMFRWSKNAGRLICFMFTNPKEWQEKLEKSMRLNVTWITCLEIGMFRWSKNHTLFKW